MFVVKNPSLDIIRFLPDIVRCPVLIFGLITAQKMKFSINDFFSKCDKIFTFTEEILNGKLRFLCSLYRKYQKTKKVIFLD